MLPWARDPSRRIALPESVEPATFRNMNWRSFVPWCGLLGGALGGWLLRAEPPAPAVAAKRTPEAMEPGTASSAVEPLRKPAVGELRELFALWGPEKVVGIYELLDGVPAATLVAWLEKLRPPETVNRGMIREQRDGIRQALVERLAECDPEALAAWLLRVPSGYIDSGWTRVATDSLLHRGTPEAEALLGKLEKAQPWVARLRLDRLAEDDPEAALQQVLRGAGPQMPPTLAKWLAADHARALAFSNEHPDKCFFVLGAVAEQGKAALEQFSAGLTHPEAQRHARRQQLTAAAREGDAAAFSALILRDGRNSNDWLQEQAMETMMKHHPEAGETLVRQFAGQQGLFKLALNSLAQEQPERAAALLAEPLSTGLATNQGDWNGAVQTLSRSWSLAHPEAALAWLRGLPDELRASAVPVAWGITNDLPTGEWLALSRGLPASHQQLRQLTQELARRTKDPVVQAEWCLSFPEESRALIQQYIRKDLSDPAAADALAQRLQILAPTP
jgi:hypothetical protein